MVHSTHGTRAKTYQVFEIRQHALDAFTRTERIEGSENRYFGFLRDGEKHLVRRRDVFSNGSGLSDRTVTCRVCNKQLEEHIGPESQCPFHPTQYSHPVP
jgi:hypothetical protein